MDWIRDIIVELIRSCIDNNESRTSIRSSMRSPTGGQKRLLERRVRKRAGMSWSEWAREGGRERLMAPVYAEGAAAQDDELDAMIDDASDVDFV